ncbi:MAG: GntR family transcriptional regulator [Proteobacteria bacterium]|nr:GntR family transcriptional regulator [Pseudomonadota bacterium]
MANQPLKSIVPLYGRIAKTVKNKIMSGHYERGSKLPSEENIGKELGVSRITIRQAFSQLEQEGWITRQRGKGTFVSDTVPAVWRNSLNSLQDIVRMISSSDLRPVGIDQIKVKDASIANDIRDFFGFSNEESIGRIQRVIMANKVPVHLVENFMPVELVKQVSKKEIREKKAVLRILNEKMDLQIGEAEVFMEAIAADQEMSDILGCQVMEPFMCNRLFLRSIAGDPIEIVNYYMRADTYKYRFSISLDDFDLSAFENR